MCAHYLPQVLTSYVPVFDRDALSQLYTCVLILLYMCPDTAIYVGRC
jgi:hypothetical protein